MQRLREGQLVALELPVERGESASLLTCSVVAVDSGEVALLPHSEHAVPQVPDVVGGIFLTFRHGPALVALNGAVGAYGDPTDLRFWVTDGVQLPRRRSTRHELALKLALTRGDEALETETVNVSADGALTAPGDALTVGDAVGFRLALDEQEAIEGEAKVVRRDGDRAALQFAGVADEDRTRLKEHVIARKRAEIEERKRAAAGARAPWLVLSERAAA